MLIKFLLVICVISSFPKKGICWGFAAHQKITHMAIYLLPKEMFGFYKANLQALQDQCIKPDQRRHLVPNEAPKHYIDFEAYGDSATWKMPVQWDSAVALYSEDTLLRYGMVPYTVLANQALLTEAFKTKDWEKVRYYSAELSHYVADAGVPLHTTLNYDGQLTGQKGIHSLWETKLTVMFMEGYNFALPEAAFVYRPSEAIWKHVRQAHNHLPMVLELERTVTQKLGEHRKYTVEERNGQAQKTYSEKFCKQYHQAMEGMVETQMQACVSLVASLWFTAWVNAGQPYFD